jgi:hypothetical protein
MKIKALTNFSGAFSMYKGEIRECDDKIILQDLLQAGYIEEVREAKKDVKSSESKRNNSK